MDKYVVLERLALTEPDEDGNQRAVPEGHPDARWFYVAEGAEIPLAEAERYGLVGKLKKAAGVGDGSTNPLEGLNAKDAAAKVAGLSAVEIALIPDTEMRAAVVAAIDARKAELATPGEE